MTIAQRLAAQKPWVRGGIVGVIVCTLLFGFYLFIYFPMVQERQRILETNSEINNAIREEDDWELAMPMFTGHLFVMLSPMILEGAPTSLLTSLCPETETHCVYWSLENDTGVGTPLVDPEGGAGYCLEQQTTPKSSCVGRVEGWIPFITFASLEAMYFTLGAIVAVAIERRNKRA